MAEPNEKKSAFSKIAGWAGKTARELLAFFVLRTWTAIAIIGLGFLGYALATKESDWLISMEPFDIRSVHRETTRMSDLNRYLFFPGNPPRPSYSEIFLRLFPPGTPVEELTSFLQRDAERPEIKSRDYRIAPRKRFSIEKYPNKMVYGYYITIPGTAWFHMLKFPFYAIGFYAFGMPIPADEEGPLNFFIGLMLAPGPFSWLIKAEIDNEERIVTIKVTVGA